MCLISLDELPCFRILNFVKKKKLCEIEDFVETQYFLQDLCGCSYRGYYERCRLIQETHCVHVLEEEKNLQVSLSVHIKECVCLYLDKQLPRYNIIPKLHVRT